MTGSYKQQQKLTVINDSIPADKQKQKLKVINDSIPADITVPSNGTTMLLSAMKVF